MQSREGGNGAHRANRDPKMVWLPMGPMTGSMRAPLDDFCHKKVIKNCPAALIEPEA